MNSKAYTFAIALIILLICWSDRTHAQNIDQKKDYRYAGQVIDYMGTLECRGGDAVINMQRISISIKAAKGSYALSTGCP